MTDDFWKSFPPMRGFSSVEMKHRAQMRIYEETKGMSPRELVEYLQGKSAVRALRSNTAPLVLNEDAPKYGSREADTK